MNIISSNRHHSISFYYSLILLFFFYISCKHEPKKIIQKFPNGDTLSIQEYSNYDDTLNYTLKYFYPSGKIYKEGSVVNGKYSGKKITYFKNGKVYQIDSLSQPSEPHSKIWSGTLIRYNENGTLSQRFTVLNGEFNGISQHYNDKGILVKEYTFKNDSTKEGDYKEYWENGKIYFRGTYYDNKLNGFAYFFNENGDTTEYELMEYDKRSFPYKKWLKQGGVLVGDFQNDKKTSITWKWFDAAGHEWKQKTVLNRKDIVFPAD